MRVQFNIANWTGDYLCMIPLGWALQAAGHEVRVLCPARQSDTVRVAGLTPVPILKGADTTFMLRFGLLMRSLEGRRTLPDLPLPLNPLDGEPLASLADFDVPAAVRRLRTEAGAAMLHDNDVTVEFAEAWRPSLVVHDMMASEGALAARLLGVPAVYCSPGLFGTVDDEIDLGPADPSRAFPRHGLPEWGRDQIEYVIDPSPDAVAARCGKAERIPVRHVPYNGSGALPSDAARVLAELRPDSGRPRVCLLWGRSAPSAFGVRLPVLRWAVDAVLDEGADLTLTAGADQVAALGELPDRVRVYRDFPLDPLLASADALIHHGSANPFMAAALRGVPQLSLSLTDDQIVMGDRFAATGAAESLPALVASRERIRAAVHELVRDAARREAAERLRAEQLARRPPTALVTDLERLAAAGGPG
ncbi:nucleotide disphospho-sugar-binding domain-containing protein [Actinomadura gamaensis]|uniref:Nucleotide disphospho-sugar-binding domain-containing protein n=1 Tax=Actinomadura gamaensis TaxID=1763541 RepID=A0ABV9U150_9ACTN